MYLFRSTSECRGTIIRFSCRFLGFFLFLLSPAITTAQAVDSVWLSDEWYYSPEPPSVVDLTRYLPQFLRDEALLKRYLRDDRFFELRKRRGDTLAVDAIFDRAMVMAEGDPERALLIAAFAVMDHRRIGLRLPIIGSVYFPLTFESDSLFRRRRTHLPKKMLPDNPRAVDKDKLQHFFGSAFLAYASRSSAFAEWIGDLLESGEQRFVLGGRDDPRDQMANAKGREFGIRLIREPDLLPSDVLWKGE